MLRWLKRLICGLQGHPYMYHEYELGDIESRLTGMAVRFHEGYCPTCGPRVWHEILTEEEE